MKNKIIKFLIYTTLIVLTFASAVFGFELDEYEDSFTLKPGEIKEGHLVIEGYTNDMDVSTQFEWVSFSKNSDVRKITDFSSYQFQNDVASIPYYIDVPKDADIGIYRTIISVQTEEETKYLNLKISVQNGFFTTLDNWYKSLSSKAIYLGVGMISLIIIIIIWFIAKDLIGDK